jgi:uncharacterized membrane protein YdcZ (DUF606 family)
MSAVRRLRGITGTALIWAVAWGVSSAFAYFVAGYGGDLPMSDLLVGVVSSVGIFFAIWGFVSGTVFALAMLVIERRRTLHELTVARTAVWGAIGGLALPALYTAATLSAPGSQPLPNGLTSAILVCGALGAACAAGSLWVARRGLPREHASAIRSEVSANALPTPPRR